MLKWLSKIGTPREKCKHSWATTSTLNHVDSYGAIIGARLHQRCNECGKIRIKES